MAVVDPDRVLAPIAVFVGIRLYGRLRFEQPVPNKPEGAAADNGVGIDNIEFAFYEGPIPGDSLSHEFTIGICPARCFLQVDHGGRPEGGALRGQGFGVTWNPEPLKILETVCPGIQSVPGVLTPQKAQVITRLVRFLGEKQNLPP